MSQYQQRSSGEIVEGLEESCSSTEVPTGPKLNMPNEGVEKQKGKEGAKVVTFSGLRIHH